MKLFRNLRKAFLGEGRLGKYLVYAIGEVLLVMVGILLAFQVDSWNNNRIKRNAEKTVYQNILDQIEDDVENLRGEKRFDSVYKVQYHYIADAIANDEREKIDSIGKLIPNMLQYSDYDKQGTLYSSMVSSGEIKLIKNLEVVSLLRDLEEQFLYVNRMEDIHYDIIMEHIIDGISPSVRFSTGEVFDESVIFGHELENVLLSVIYVMDEKEMVYNETIATIEHLRGILLEELEK